MSKKVQSAGLRPDETCFLQAVLWCEMNFRQSLYRKTVWIRTATDGDGVQVMFDIRCFLPNFAILLILAKAG